MTITETPVAPLRRVIVLPDADPSFARAVVAVLRLRDALTPEEFAARVAAGRRPASAP